MRSVRVTAFALLIITAGCGNAEAISRVGVLHVPAGALRMAGRANSGHEATRLATASGAPALGQPNEIISHGRFKGVTIYRPDGEVKQFVLFLSGHDGWSSTAAAMADALSDEGALVAGINVPKLLADFKRDGATCVFPDGDLENLSHFVQAYYKVPTYLTPILAGYSAGATLAYTMAEQAPRGLFAGALSVGLQGKFDSICPPAPIPATRAQEGSANPVQPGAASSARGGNGFVSVSLPTETRKHAEPSVWRPQLRGALARITGGRSERLPPPPKSLADLPVVEVPTAEAKGDVFAVFLSGDGGWAGLDRALAQSLAERGIPVAGVDSLRYFWTVRTPDGLAQDLDRTVRYYAAQWNKSRVLMIGFSQGADVLPFAVNRLPAATRDRVQLVTLLSVGTRAMFEFHLTNWITDGKSGLPIVPEIDRLPGSVQCIYGADDDDSACAGLTPAQAHVTQLPGGHHFNGDYDRLSRLILDQAGLVATATAANAAGAR